MSECHHGTGGLCVVCEGGMNSCCGDDIKCEECGTNICRRCYDEIIKTLWKSPVYDDIKILTQATNCLVKNIIDNASASSISFTLDPAGNVPGFNVIYSILNTTDPILINSKKYRNFCGKYTLHALNILMMSISKQTEIPVRLEDEYKDHTSGKNKLSEGIALCSGKTHYYFHIWW